MKSTTPWSNERDWNDNLGFLKRLDSRFDEANEAANQGFLITWYRHLRTIYRIMHHKIYDDDEKRVLNDKEIKVDVWLQIRFSAALDSIRDTQADHGNKIITQQVQTMSVTDAEEKLDEIDTVLSDLYVKYFIRLEAERTEPDHAIEEVFQT